MGEIVGFVGGLDTVIKVIVGLVATVIGAVKTIEVIWARKDARDEVLAQVFWLAFSAVEGMSAEAREATPKEEWRGPRKFDKYLETIAKMLAAKGEKPLGDQEMTRAKEYAIALAHAKHDLTWSGP